MICYLKITFLNNILRHIKKQVYITLCLHITDQQIRQISGGKPVPRKVIDYGDVKIALNQHCVGAVCFYTKECLDKVGLYDESYTNAFEHVDHSYELAKANYSTPYWWWADIENSLDYVEEQACSEDNSAITSQIRLAIKYSKISYKIYRKTRSITCTCT
jgi:GT2 family glycosyltransferase